MASIDYRLVQEAVADQLKSLEEKLHEYKVRHKADEESVEDEIATLEDTLAEVKVSGGGNAPDFQVQITHFPPKIWIFGFVCIIFL